ncbi:hypothetical protein NIES25_34560 [Nostoc linckia NIES-25]|nr:hypothetical protein NIES25_34560 [Nostoc linckia NIES-25]
MLNYFYIKDRLSYIKSLKTYVGNSTYLLYCRFDRYKFLVDTLQQVMLSFEKLYFAKLDAAESLLKYVEKLVKIICLMTIRPSTTRSYICSRVSD